MIMPAVESIDRRAVTEEVDEDDKQRYQTGSLTLSWAEQNTKKRYKNNE
jgi:hypothetical protein